MPAKINQVEIKTSDEVTSFSSNQLRNAIQRKPLAKLSNKRAPRFLKACGQRRKFWYFYENCGKVISKIQGDLSRKGDYLPRYIYIYRYTKEELKYAYLTDKTLTDYLCI